MEVWRRHNGICHICRCPVPAERFDVEHVVAVANGGTHTYDNLAPAHRRCNLRKGDKTQAELAAEDARKGLRRTAFRREPQELTIELPPGVKREELF